jgi:NADP-dependent 3-hydroxy acid dehydrogenase YdfG
MSSSPQRTVIVTGTSGGIGAAIASQLSLSGWRVFGTMRRPEPARHGPDALALDVTSDDSVEAAVAEVLRRTGRIDAIVNNAGVDMIGAIEETTAKEAVGMFQTNFFGVHRLIRAVLPTMRAQQSGRIVTIGSIAGFVPTPYNAFYSASKQRAGRLLRNARLRGEAVWHPHHPDRARLYSYKPARQEDDHRQAVSRRIAQSASVPVQRSIKGLARVSIRPAWLLRLIRPSGRPTQNFGIWSVTMPTFSTLSITICPALCSRQG